MPGQLKYLAVFTDGFKLSELFPYQIFDVRCGIVRPANESCGLETLVVDFPGVFTCTDLERWLTVFIVDDDALTRSRGKHGIWPFGGLVAIARATTKQGCH